jgi:hypothetical protein
MRKKTVFSALAPLFLLASCTEMDTVLPSSVTYQVSALVEKSSLDTYSIIDNDDVIRPVFMNSVTNDPDVTGLLVYLQFPDGKTVGEKVYYSLKKAESPGQDPVQNVETTGDSPKEEEIAPKSTGNTTNDGEIFVHVSRLDKDIPAFPLPEDLEIGRYSLIFEVWGEKQVLYRTERPIYYIADAEFTLTDIQSYLPGLSAASHLIPPGLAIMLETQVAVDERLDPYIVWYDGKQRITEGRIADGTGRILWEAPAQTGFHTIRAEVFPFAPLVYAKNGDSPAKGRSLPELRGKTRELSLPVSAKGGKPGFFVPGVGEPLLWYQFAGNLRDSVASGDKEKELTRNGGDVLGWVPSDGIYGLSVKAGDTYQLPPLAFALDGDKQGGGRFLLRVKPMREGRLFTAFFKAAGSTGDILTMNLVYREQGLLLSLESEGLNAAAVLPLNMPPEDPETNPAANTFITVAVDFHIRENTFIVSLDRENDSPWRSSTASLPALVFPADSPAALQDLPANLARIELSRPLNGKINCRLGTSPEDPLWSSAEESDKEAEASVESGTQAALEATLVGSTALPGLLPLAIFDEFAVMSPSPPSNG